MKKCKQLTGFLGAMLLVACTERKIPEIEHAARICDVSYSAMKDAYVYSTLPGRSSRTRVLGRCEINQDSAGRVTTRILNRPYR